MVQCRGQSGIISELMLDEKDFRMTKSKQQRGRSWRSSDHDCDHDAGLTLAATANINIYFKSTKAFMVHSWLREAKALELKLNYLLFANVSISI